MQVNDPPTQQYYCATLIIPGFLLIYKVNLSNGFVCCIGLCRDTYTCTAFLFALQMPTGAGIVPPPRAALLGNISAQTYFYHVKERENI